MSPREWWAYLYVEVLAGGEVSRAGIAVTQRRVDGLGILGILAARCQHTA